MWIGVVLVPALEPELKRRLITLVILFPVYRPGVPGKVQFLVGRSDLVLIVLAYQVSEAGMTGLRPYHYLGDNASGNLEGYNSPASLEREFRYSD